MVVSITIPDAVVPRVINGVANAKNYQSTIVNGSGQTVANPETKGQFVKRQMIEWLILNLKQYEVSQAMQSATTTAITSVDTDISIT